MVKTMTVAAAMFAALTTVALAAGPTTTVQTSKGTVLADSKGMTLYTFDKDASGKSNCNGKCATNWPPLKAAANAKDSGKFSVVTRDDGGKQWAYEGKPLYTWIKDKKKGDTTGDGVNNNTWHVAKP